jgi:hypothetical protein
MSSLLPDDVRLRRRYPSQPQPPVGTGGGGGQNLGAEIEGLVRILRGYRGLLAEDAQNCSKAGLIGGAAALYAAATPATWPLAVGIGLCAAGLGAQSFVTRRNATATGSPPYLVFQNLVHSAYGVDESLVRRWADQLVSLGVFRRPQYGWFDTLSRRLDRVPSLLEIRGPLAVSEAEAQAIYCALRAIQIDLASLGR